MNTRRRRPQISRPLAVAVAVFRGGPVEGEVVAEPTRKGIRLSADFTKLPPGKHGFHIHTAGDLRGEGCKGACAHYHKGPHASHGPGPTHTRKRVHRHTGDLGNIELGPKQEKAHYSYELKGVSVSDLWGRSIIVHADEDDLGLGPYDDSKTTGHSGARIGCAIFGRGTLKACS